MIVNAYAKINICLNVKGKRLDGYHELEMIMVPITLHDTITIDFHDIDLYSTNESEIPMDASNTVVKAVALMRKTYGLKDHFKIHVEKQIPAQAGLAGGSADGAAVMRAINELCNLQIPIEELALLGKEIGADVPFCVMQKSAVVKGIGEIIDPFTVHCDFDILLVKPSEGVPTGKAFSLLDFDACAHPNYEEVRRCLEEDHYEELFSCCSNSLEYSAFQIVPIIRDIKQELLDRGMDFALMSGSGSSVFAFTRNKECLKQVAHDMKNQGYFVCETHLL